MLGGRGGPRAPAGGPRVLLVPSFAAARRLRQRAGGRHDGRATQPRRREADGVGTFDSPVLRDAAARRAQAPVRRGAGGPDPRRARRAQRCARRSSTSRGRVVSGGEQGLLWMAFAPDYASSGRFYVDYTDRDGDSAGRRVPARLGARPRRRRQRAARSCAMDQPESNHNGGQLRSGRTACSTSASATAAGATTSTGRAATGRTSARCSARSCGSTRGRAAGGRTRSRATTRSSGGRRAAGDLRLRAAQPVALLVRPQDRRPRDRRRRPGRGRGDRLRAAAAARRGRELRLARVRGDAAQRLRRAGAAATCSRCSQYSHADGGCSITGGYVVRDPRAAALDGRYVYGDFCAGDLFAAKLRQDGARGHAGTVPLGRWKRLTRSVTPA